MNSYEEKKAFYQSALGFSDVSVCLNFHWQAAALQQDQDSAGRHIHSPNKAHIFVRNIYRHKLPFRLCAINAHTDSNLHAIAVPTSLTVAVS